MESWEAPKIYYIKLGVGGEWWDECKHHRRIKLGYNSGDDKIYQMSRAGDWDAITEYWKSERIGTPTQFTNQMRTFFEDDGEILWITFEDGCLYHAFSDGGKIIRASERSGFHGFTTWRNLKGNGWTNLDSEGRELRMGSLNGRLTKTAGYRGTICGLDAEKYLRNRLQCIESLEIKELKASKDKTQAALIPVIKTLTWQDFELLVELIFSNSGWRRTTRTGGTQKTTDLDLSNPITGDLIFVQVKSQTNQQEFEEYRNRQRSERQNYKTMYYVYHSGKVDIPDETDGKVDVWPVETVAKQVLANGLLDWVLEKAG